MHSSFRSLLGIAFDVLAHGGSEPASHGFFVASLRSRSINLAVKLGAKNMHENLFMFKTIAWMNKLPMTVDFFWEFQVVAETHREYLPTWSKSFYRPRDVELKNIGLVNVQPSDVEH